MQVKRRLAYYSDEQIQIFDDLNAHYQKWGTLEGFPSAKLKRT